MALPESNTKAHEHFHVSKYPSGCPLCLLLDRQVPEQYKESRIQG